VSWVAPNVTVVPKRKQKPGPPLDWPVNVAIGCVYLWRASASDGVSIRLIQSIGTQILVWLDDHTVGHPLNGGTRAVQKPKHEVTVNVAGVSAHWSSPFGPLTAAASRLWFSASCRPSVWHPGQPDDHRKPSTVFLMLEGSLDRLTQLGIGLRQ
jgi:hypothetical protein